MATRPNFKSGWHRNRWFIQGDLQSQLTDPHPGWWMPAEGLWPLAVTIGGTFATINANILVANQLTIPADADVGYPALINVIAPAVYTITQPFAWIKFQVVAITGGFVLASYMATSGSTD